MKKFISILLSITMIATSVNIVFANDVENGDILTYNGVVGSKDNLLMDISDETPSDIITVSEYVEESCIPNKNALLSVGDNIEPMTLSEIEELNEDKVIGYNVYYAKQYVDKGVEVIVRLYVNIKGEVWFSDAWGNLLK